MHDKLVNDIHHNSNKKDPSYMFPTLSQEHLPADWIAVDDGPKEEWTAGSCILHSRANREESGNQRLENQAKR